jgi:prepilin-type N-terminal cleavage/methylation domain-containing protein
MRRLTGDERGFSAAELMVVVGIVGVVSAMAVFQIGAAQPAIRGDGAMRIIMGNLNTARERSITERRNFIVEFIEPNQVRLERQEVPVGTTVLSTIPLEGGVRFYLFDHLPDTPEAFGKGGAIDFGAAETILFSTDGTLINQSGAPANGTVFLGIPGQPRSARAVTVLGTTGRVRAYKWDGSRWVRG